MANASPKTARIVGICFIALPMIFLGFGLWQAHLQGIALKDYRPAPATVVSAHVQSHSGDDGDTYSPEVNYRYVVKGRPYLSQRTTVLSISTSGHWAWDVVARYPPGTQTIAYYDPASPGDAYLIHAVDFFPYIFILFPMIFVCVGLGILFNGSRTGDTMNHPGALATTVLWNTAGVLTAMHYFSLTRTPDLSAKIGFSLYGLIGALMLYATMYLWFTTTSQAPATA